MDYTRKAGLLHEEFVLPADAPAWVRTLIADRSVAGASEAFWNRVEAFEKRSDAQLAKDLTIALPLELTGEQNIALVRDFVERHILSKGMVADWAYHDDPGNPHIHLMMTLRPLSEDGFGPKKIPVLAEDGQPLRSDRGKIVYELWAGGTAEFNAFRDAWFERLNLHLAQNGIDLRVDGRSYEKQGVDLVPTIHLGVGAKAIERKAQAALEQGNDRAPRLERIELQEQRRDENARRVQENPRLVLDLVTREKSVFDERDVAKILHRYIDDPAQFRTMLARVLQDPDVLRLERERVSLASGVRDPDRYTTRDLIRLEAGMAARAIWLSRRSSHGVREKVLDSGLAHHDGLSEEQRSAVAHVAGEKRIAAVVGRAGAGKTTMMRAAREIWEASGYRVVGGALAGKAAEGLEKEAGIRARTLSSWELSWQQERDRLDAKTIFVLDEAGMVSSRQMALFVEAATKAGAKLVLVGDPDQLQPIEAGAAFRAIVDRIGYAELGTIYRQREAWMRTASVDLARGRVADALAAYDDAGMLRTGWTREDATLSLIEDWNRDFDPLRTSLILAHRRSDVRMLNELARGKLLERGVLGEGSVFETEDGTRRFAAGDQIVFLRNEGSLGVKNGMLGKVVEAEPDRIVAEIGERDARRQVTIEQRFYANLDHGYATTVHKSQGATVDDVKMLASATLDRHLTYVALTRHRDAAQLYVGLNEFTNRGGVLVDHGVAPYENKPGNRDSYFVTLETGAGKQNTIWGVDLKRAMAEAAPAIGDRIGLEHRGSEKVRLPDGSQAERHIWKVVDVRALAVARLTERLSRDASKETTLDYARSTFYRQALRFAESRGLHTVRVARTLLRDRFNWMLGQKPRLAELGQRLRGLALWLGLAAPRQTQPTQEERPMVAGVTLFPKPLSDMVEEKLRTDPAVKAQWDEVSTRFRYVFADPETAFRTMNFDAVLADRQTATRTLDRLIAAPDSVGPLRGKTGLFARPAERADRQVAERNVPMLRQEIERYLQLRQKATEVIEKQELAHRHRVSIDIPALSPAAARVLERVRDAIDRNDLPAAPGFAIADREVKAEIDRFNRAVSERFGERALLANAAREPFGKLFDRAAEGLAPSEKQRLAEAWPTMRIAQQLAAHERTAETLKQTENLRQTQRQTPVVKP